MDDLRERRRCEEGEIVRKPETGFERRALAGLLQQARQAVAPQIPFEWLDGIARHFRPAVRI
jgi:hypothetical protein